MAVLQKWYVQCRRAKYLQFELILEFFLKYYYYFTCDFIFFFHLHLHFHFSSLTFTPSQSYFSIRITTRIAAATYDPTLAFTLPSLLVTILTKWSWFIAITRIAGVTQFNLIVFWYKHHWAEWMVLQKWKALQKENGAFITKCFWTEKL